MISQNYTKAPSVPEKMWKKFYQVKTRKKKQQLNVRTIFDQLFMSDQGYAISTNFGHVYVRFPIIRAMPTVMLALN